MDAEPNGAATRIERPALDRDALCSRLAGGFVTSLSVVDEVSSTNAELLRAAAAGAPEGTVLVAEWQNAGRGRFDRVWTSPPRAGLTFSIVLRPDAVPVHRWTWIPLLAGVALRRAVLGLPGVRAGEARLKWPNDLLLGPHGAKAAGILAEVERCAGPERGAGLERRAVVLGMGVNVHHRPDELPGPQATSLDAAFPGCGVGRADLLVAVLTGLGSLYTEWVAHAGDPSSSGLRPGYEQACDTLGRRVDIDQNGVLATGTAVGLDDTGALLVDTGRGVRAISAGDLAHRGPRPR